MKKAINGLVSIVEGEMDADSFSADLYIFCNRARNLVKMVAWEGNGFVLWKCSTLRKNEPMRVFAQHRLVPQINNRGASGVHSRLSCRLGLQQREYDR